MQAPAVDVYGIDLAISDREGEQLARWLDDVELERVAGLRFERDRLRLIAAHAGMRLCLSRYVGEAPGALKLHAPPFEKPRLPEHGSCHFNLSHSGELALLAVCETGSVGIDVERVRDLDDMDAVAREVFIDEECEALAAAPPADRCRAFFNGWTRKEALIKATGEGFRADLSRIGVTLTPGAAPLVTRWPRTLPQNRRWRLASFEPRPGFVAAVACRGRVPPTLAWRGLSRPAGDAD